MIESGSKVFWNDPDNGLCSGEYIVWDVTISDSDELIYHIGEDTQVFLHELEELD